MPLSARERTCHVATIAADLPKKSRTPPPPRVQAPKTRRAPAPPGRNRTIVLGVVVALVVAAVAAALVLFVFGGGSADAALEEAGCTVERAPAQGREHVEELEEGFEYNTSPPTTGPHHPQWAIWDVYTEPVEQFRLVHNLEHGGVIIQYGSDVPQATVDEIVTWYREDPNGIIVAPFPELGSQISLGAWVTPDPVPGEEAPTGEGVLAKCSSFDEEAFDSFVDEYGFRGPERFPRDQLEPGTA
jgi:hypothetical protein